MPAIQIRNVPDDVHRRLKARAAFTGQSLSEHVLAVMRRSLERPTVDELLDRIQSRGTVDPGVDVVEMVRSERDAR